LIGYTCAVPDLPVAFRGYSRLAVEEHVAELEAALLAAQDAYQRASAEAAQLREQLAQTSGRRPAAAPADVRVFEEPAVEPPEPIDEPAEAAVEPTEPGRDTAPRPGRRGRHLILPALALIAVVVAAVLVLTDEDTPVATAPPAAQPRTSAAPSAAASRAAPPAPSATPAAPVPLTALRPLPSDWEGYRDPQSRYAIGLPLSWRAAGPDRFLSSSGKSELRVASNGAATEPTLAALRTREKAFAAAHRGYRRIGLAIVPFHGLPAGVWSYTYGAGANMQRASELTVLVDGSGYRLRVASRAANWSFVSPIVAAFRGTFHPAGLPASS
jgi:hypothetical protein